MLSRFALFAMAVGFLFGSNAIAQERGGADKIDRELAEIRRTLAEMRDALSQMADTLDRIDGSLKHRPPRLEFRVFGTQEKPVTTRTLFPPVLFPRDVERAMIHEGKIYHRTLEKLEGGYEVPGRSSRSIFEPPRNTLEPPSIRKRGIRVLE